MQSVEIPREWVIRHNPISPFKPENRVLAPSTELTTTNRMTGKTHHLPDAPTSVELKPIVNAKGLAMALESRIRAILVADPKHPLHKRRVEIGYDNCGAHLRISSASLPSKDRKYEAHYSPKANLDPKRSRFVYNQDSLERAIREIRDWH